MRSWCPGSVLQLLVLQCELFSLDEQVCKICPLDWQSSAGVIQPLQRDLKQQ
jgi:hypothetical protein